MHYGMIIAKCRELITIGAERHMVELAVHKGWYGTVSTLRTTLYWSMGICICTILNAPILYSTVPYHNTFD